VHLKPTGGSDNYETRREGSQHLQGVVSGLKNEEHEEEEKKKQHSQRCLLIYEGETVCRVVGWSIN